MVKAWFKSTIVTIVLLLLIDGTIYYSSVTLVKAWFKTISIYHALPTDLAGAGCLGDDR